MSTSPSMKKIIEMPSDEESDNPKKDMLKKSSTDNSMSRSLGEEQIDQGESAKDYQYEFIMHVVKPYK